MGKKSDSPLPDSVSVQQLELALANIVGKMSGVKWAALITAGGLLAEAHPDKVASVGDRVAAMGASVLSLAELIASDLDNGDLRYTLIAGKKGGTAILTLSTQYKLVLGLGPTISVDGLLMAISPAAAGLLTLLKIKKSAWA